MAKGAFHRVMTMMAAVAKVLADVTFQNNIAARKEALADIGVYRSRGHGLNRYSSRRFAGPSVAQSKRDALKRRNRQRNKQAHRRAV